MFERFDERARQVVVLAQDEARLLRHNYIGTEHILLGLLREEDGTAAVVLKSVDITFEEVRAQVVGIVGQGDEVTTGQIPFTPRAKRVLESSLREALSLGHNHIGTEHLLLGLLRETEGVASRILADLSSPEAVWAKAMQQVGVERPFQPAPRMRQHMSLGSEVQLGPMTLLDDSAWLAMIAGALLFGIGLFVGWLIWG